MSSHVAGVLEGRVFVITLQRAEKKNALTETMYETLADCLERAERDDAVRAILLQGEGHSFTAGNDLADFVDQADRPDFRNKPFLRFIRALSSASKPIVAAVQGHAVGIGTTMLLHCDLVYLAEDARLATPFINLALVPEAASSLLLPARIGHVKAYQMFALGQPLDAATALACGLANALVPGADLHERALQAAVELAKRPPGALRSMKALMRDQTIIAARIQTEADLFGAHLQSAEARAAFATFFEKRG